MATKSKTRKRKRQAKKEEEGKEVSYWLKVRGWDYEYNFLAGRDIWGRGIDALEEYKQLIIRAELIVPEKHKYKRWEIEISPLPPAEVVDVDEDVPLTAGNLSAEGYLAEENKILRVLISIPDASLSELVTVAASGKLDFIEILGSKLRHRSGRVSSITICTRLPKVFNILESLRRRQSEN